MHVLLTGTTGYIGSAVLKAVIQTGPSVTALVLTADGWGQETLATVMYLTRQYPMQ